MRKEPEICCAGMCSKPTKKRDKYCSMHRARLSRHGRLDKETYIEMIFKNSKLMQNGCIEWQGYKNKLGYGRRHFNGTKQLVHRMVYMLIHGGNPIPFGLLVCHTCDNSSCINPAHLFLGTHADNIHDCIRKGRAKKPKGEKHWASKLTENQAIYIKSNSLPVNVLAKKYNVTKDTICNIQKGRTWKHL